jgi:hypothetical protein
LDTHEWAVALSKAADARAQQLVHAVPDFSPLLKAIPVAWRFAFMWMGETFDSDQPIQIYKHGITRRYLLLDHKGNAFRPTTLEPTSVWEAIESVYSGLEFSPYSRETPYTDDLIAERARALRAAGWTVIHSSSLRYSD